MSNNNETAAIAAKIAELKKQQKSESKATSAIMEFFKGVDNENSSKRLICFVLVAFLLYLVDKTNNYSLARGDINHSMELINLVKYVVLFFGTAVFGDRAIHKVSNATWFKK